MFRIDWSNPKTTVDVIEQVVSPYLGSKYDGLLTEGGFLYVRTTDELTGAEEDGIRNLIFNLNQISQNVSVISQPDPVPFAQPTYRTKRDAGSYWETCPSDAITHDDFLMISEKYVSGGGILIKDAKEGDFITAEVIDIDGVIPSPYRSAMCESHPTVATYIVKMWVLPFDGYRKVEIDTYPLNAKITAGLYLRVSYHASAVEGDRKMAINYNLTKKL